MTITDRGPAPGLVQDWITPGAFWLFLVLLVIAVLTPLLIRKLRHVWLQKDTDPGRHRALTYRSHTWLGQSIQEDSPVYDQEKDERWP